ncbi:MAG: ABC transporter substrate-binding protein [Candidatus Methanomethylicia archaeon]
MYRYKKEIGIIITIVMLLLSLIQSSSTVNAQLPPGIPRGDILVASMDEPGRIAEPEWGNIWVPGRVVGAMYVFEPLWYGNITNGKIIPCLAETLPLYEDNHTKMKFRIKSGIYWSDGVEFTADDVVFTIMLQKNVTGMTNTALFRAWVKTAYAEDKYTVVIEFLKPAPKFYEMFVNVVGFGSILIMPKHIFEKVENPLTFPFFPPIGTSPYILKSYDPQGYWFLFERREDWYNTGIGRTFGKPRPKYILRIYHGGDEKEIIAFSKHELDFSEIGFPSIDAALKASPYVRGWWRTFPHSWSEVCSPGAMFNTARFPYNITEVRWALTLAINITEIEITAINCEAALASFFTLLNPYAAYAYKDIILPWLKNFTIDGIKVFDDSIPYKLAEYVKKVLRYELSGDPISVYSYGWYRYAPEAAAQLLIKNGFKKGADGKWYLPDGSPWRLNLIESTHPFRSIIVTGLAEQWRKFGIDVQLEILETPLYTRRMQLGDFDVCGTAGLCAYMPDTWRLWEGALNKLYYKPLGEVAVGLYHRWVNDRVSSLLDEVALLPLNDPEAIKRIAEIAKIVYANAVYLPVFLTTRAIMYDEYAWTNWPTGENMYWGLSYWNPVYILPVTVYIKPTGRAPTSELVSPLIPYTYVTSYATEDIPSFIGADGKIYGPYKKGDAMIIPKEDADRLLAEGKVSLTPPVSPEFEKIVAIISEIMSRIYALEGGINTIQSSINNVNNVISTMNNKIDNLTTAITNMTTLTAGIAILVLISIVVMIIRTRPTERGE